ncbi:anthrone oxygenase family protein [Mycobacterium sp. 2YAF39]|uniref:anthrone oxygenase family protein n=1 Tax=Mycobacterium sp. 2YAF39 TaxID=3233033 RepID=UPI003F953980
MREIIEILALVIAGPMVGVEFAVGAFTNPAFGRLPDDAFRQARSHASRVLGRVMPFWYVATLVVLIAATVVTWPNWLLFAATAVMAAVVLMTVTLMVPINNRIGGWTDAVDRDLARRWDRLHWLRVTLLLAMVVLLATGMAE